MTTLSTDMLAAVTGGATDWNKLRADMQARFTQLGNFKLPTMPTVPTAPNTHVYDHCWPKPSQTTPADRYAPGTHNDP